MKVSREEMATKNVLKEENEKEWEIIAERRESNGRRKREKHKDTEMRRMVKKKLRREKITKNDANEDEK